MNIIQATQKKHILVTLDKCDNTLYPRTSSAEIYLSINVNHQILMKKSLLTLSEILLFLDHFLFLQKTTKRKITTQQTQSWFSLLNKKEMNKDYKDYFI